MAKEQPRLISMYCQVCKDFTTCPKEKKVACENFVSTVKFKK